ncbi:hypothetical protein EDD18DRAFT_1346760 [Armillaria luteobubalina]|uniref:RING-type domain-containing protein n=1 Tax=Armillaria luteobubalina TaxID=153913 RepID=A0AA39QGW7_9AGAR|nr:hypothetical protein EDD18DRAFT_1346760 [Armillaria luteobubalina]
MNNLTHASASAAGTQHGKNVASAARTQHGKNIWCKDRVKGNRVEATPAHAALTEISSDDDELPDKNSSHETEDLQMLVKILLRETRDAKRAQATAESGMVRYDTLMKAAGNAENALKKAEAALKKSEQRVVQYEACIEEQQKQLVKLTRTLASLQDDVVCVLCKETLWYLYLLPNCGHLYCEACIQKWLENILKQHQQQAVPLFFWSQPVEIPTEVTTAMMHPYIAYPLVITLFEQIRTAMDGLNFTCPQCGKVLRNHPVAVNAMMNIVEKVTSTHGVVSDASRAPVSVGSIGDFIDDADVDTADDATIGNVLHDMAARLAPQVPYENHDTEEDESDHETIESAPSKRCYTSKKRRTKYHTFQFTQNHPLVNTHHVKVCPTSEHHVPNFVGGMLPQKDKGDGEYYCLVMLTFTLWRSGKDLKLDAETTWDYMNASLLGMTSGLN